MVSRHSTGPFAERERLASDAGDRRLMRCFFAALFSLFACGALAANVRMELGPLEQRPGAIVRQWVRVANAGVESVPRLYVQCTFFFLGRARSNGGVYTASLKPGQALSISVGGGDTRADRAECAIKDTDQD